MEANLARNEVSKYKCNYTLIYSYEGLALI